MSGEQRINRTEPLFAAVPNISEGRSRTIIGAIADAIERGGAYLADVHGDVDHNRSVFTCIGEAATLRRSLTAAATVAVERIDLTMHTGVHPRVGVVDVMPLVPLADIDQVRGGAMTDAASVADELARDLAEAAGVPTIRYGTGCPFQRAGDLRNGGLVRLARRMEAGEVSAVAGSPVIDPRAGVMLVGARPVLIAFNVLLDTGDLTCATSIAAQIREPAVAGLPGIRAIGVNLASRGVVQVSANIERWRDTGPADVVRAVHAHAKARSVRVLVAELVGLAPAAALRDLTLTGIEVEACPDPSLESHIGRAASRMGGLAHDC